MYLIATPMRLLLAAAVAREEREELRVEDELLLQLRLRPALSASPPSPPSSSSLSIPALPFSSFPFSFFAASSLMSAHSLPLTNVPQQARLAGDHPQHHRSA